MTFDEGLRLFSVVAIVASSGLNVWMFLKTRSDDRFKLYDAQLKAMQTQFDARMTAEAEQRRNVGQNLAQMGNRVAAIEARLSGLATHNDLSGIRSELSGLAERTETTYEIVRSLQDFLMKGGKS
ncbi:hypothetical protein C7S18_12215 [Ahniella affigens]|uniref:DUF2730 domain-containing protein n=1 Tax=Ahniella affigens TaxID=2021234 RepID=A0A2P1PSV1_9GAMM|nr:hypothetical protein [Ahniella affigens]AVP97916.1 hypothetical protein C7S18_12215 [Ahniella affigens]